MWVIMGKAKKRQNDPEIVEARRKKREEREKEQRDRFTSALDSIRMNLDR